MCIGPGGRKKPPISVVQYGIPEIPKLRPAGICRRKVAQFAETSPDQEMEPLRC